MSNRELAIPDTMDQLQCEAFDYFIHEVNPSNGLVRDKTKRDSPASIAAVGLALSSYPIAIERGFITRSDACRRVLATLRFFDTSTQSTDPDATGYKGFYYHFLHMDTGKRAWKCELSTIDSGFLFAGMLTAATYFTGTDADESEIRVLTDSLYRRADWNWAQNEAKTISHGWDPESGFLPYTWQGYDEALFLYVLGLGSPTHPLPEESYAEWTSTYEWRKVYDYEFLYSGPLFTHQISHLWIDFRGITDDFMKSKRSDYFENSRRATHVQRRYAIENPERFMGYGENSWGITASDGPGSKTRTIDGRKRQFFGYEARGVPDGPDDGSISPWAVVASLPFAPQIVLLALECFETRNLRKKHPYGFKATFNTTYSGQSDASKAWESPYHFGLNQGPIVMMIENYRTGLLWNLMRKCPYLVTGLRRAGFEGGWLDKKD